MALRFTDHIWCRGRSLPFVHLAPTRPDHPVVCFLPGFRSECLHSIKSQALFDMAKENGFGFMTWDYLYQGAGTSVQRWAEDSYDILRQRRSEHSLVLVGASMGTWIALLLARTRLRIQHVIGIGASVDSTEHWLREAPSRSPSYTWRRPSRYSPDGHYDIPISFLLLSKPALLLNKTLIHLPCPVHLFHGAQDRDVPLSHAQELQQRLGATLTVIPNGDHRLSRPSDVKQMCGLIHETCQHQYQHDNNVKTKDTNDSDLTSSF